MEPQVIKSLLLSRRTEVLSRYHDELDRATEELASREAEAVEQAAEQWDARVLSILGTADAAALGLITSALRRLDDGGYGRCIQCGVEIDPARLRVFPEAPSCFDCAFEAERARGMIRAAH